MCQIPLHVFLDMTCSPILSKLKRLWQHLEYTISSPYFLNHPHCISPRNQFTRHVLPYHMPTIVFLYDNGPPPLLCLHKSPDQKHLKLRLIANLYFSLSTFNPMNFLELTGHLILLLENIPSHLPLLL